MAKQFLAVAPTLPAKDSVFVLNRLAHDGAYRDPDFWAAAARALTPMVSDLPGDLLGLAANAFSRAEAHDPVLMGAISERLARSVEGVPCDSLALVIDAARRCQAPRRKGGLADSMATRLPGQLLKMSERDAAMLLASFGEQGVGGHEVLEGIRAQGLPVVTKLPPTAIAQLLQAFARLAVRDTSLLSGLKPLVIAQLHQFPPQSVSMAANAYVRLTASDAEFLSAISTSAAADLRAEEAREDEEALSTTSTTPRARGAVTLAKGGGYDHVAVTQLLNAHAKTSVLHREFFEAAADWMTSARLATFTPQSLANALHAFAKFPALRAGHAGRRQWRAVFASFVPEVMRQLPSFSVQNAVNTLQAFSALTFREESLLRDTVRHVLSRRTAWNSQDVANLASALAKLDFFDDAAFEAIAVALAVGNASGFRVGELAPTLNALAHYARLRVNVEGGRPPAGINAAFAAASLRLDRGMLARSSNLELSIVVNAYSKVSFPNARPVSDGLSVMDERAVSEPAALASVNLVLNVLARRGQMPSASFARAAACVAEQAGKEDAHEHHGGLDGIRIASLLSSLVRLGVQPGSELWPWVPLLCQKLRSSLQGVLRTAGYPNGGCCTAPAVDGDSGAAIGKEDAGAPSKAWNAQTFLTAVGALSMLGGEAQKSLRETWWRCVELLLACLVHRFAPTQQRRRPHQLYDADGVAVDRVAARQLRQALLALQFFHLQPASRAGAHPRPLELYSNAAALARASDAALSGPAGGRNRDKPGGHDGGGGDTDLQPIMEVLSDASTSAEASLLGTVDDLQWSAEAEDAVAEVARLAAASSGLAAILRHRVCGVYGVEILLPPAAEADGG